MSDRRKIKLPVTIHRLNACTCRWPLWGSDLRKPPSVKEAIFCGEMPLPNRAYCEKHTLLSMRYPNQFTKHENDAIVTEVRKSKRKKETA